MANINIKGYTPSIITFIRIILSPILFLTVIYDFFIYSLIIFFLAIVTDVVDGYISRRWNVSSSKGAYFDVTADFILVLQD
jgi:phosphatidylglycerophosphate synthase